MIKRITSHEVAHQAGVSQSTVSRAFSGDVRLSKATRERVLKIARDLGYQPNAIARSLITRRTQIIGIVAARMTNPFFPYVLEVYTRRLHEMGWRVLLYTAGQGEEVDDLLPEVLAYQVDGLIIISSQLSSRMADEVLARGTPVVLFNRYVRGSRASAVCCDNYGGGRLVAQTLLERGYRHLAYIAGPEETLTNQDRERGFGEYLTQHGIGEWLREPGNYTYEAGFAATARLLGRSDPPQAIFCGNDITAIGALDAARELKRLVPADIAIIGFDGIPQGNWGAYALTTVRQPMEAMIERSLGLLLERIASPELEVIHEFLPGTLVERGSLRQVGEPGP